MKVDATKRISIESITDPPAWLPDLLSPLNSSLEQLQTAMQSNLTIADNLNATVKQYDFVHGVELSVKNPLKVKPIGVTALYCADQAVVSCKLRYLQTGDIGVTIKYDLDHGYPFLYASKSGNQIITKLLNTALTWQTTQQNVGGVFTIGTTTSRLTVSQACRIHVVPTVTFDAVTPGIRDIWIRKNGSGAATATDRGIIQGIEAATAGQNSLNSSGYFDMAASDYVEVFVYHTRDPSCAVIGNTAFDTTVQVQQVRNNTTPSAKVSVLIWGG